MSIVCSFFSQTASVCEIGRTLFNHRFKVPCMLRIIMVQCGLELHSEFSTSEWPKREGLMFKKTISKSRTLYWLWSCTEVPYKGFPKSRSIPATNHMQSTWKISYMYSKCMDKKCYLMFHYQNDLLSTVWDECLQTKHSMIDFRTPTVTSQP